MQSVHPDVSFFLFLTATTNVTYPLIERILILDCLVKFFPDVFAPVLMTAVTWD